MGSRDHITDDRIFLCISNLGLGRQERDGGKIKYSQNITAASVIFFTADRRLSAAITGVMGGPNADIPPHPVAHEIKQEKSQHAFRLLTFSGL